ncbi:MAG: hypothetical protein AVDCRST_MAG17-299 [uncultured Solirubrobacterales bacterium]|uniref:Transglycosylase associated protein n=1 Tax=uncultured Solirubrobacterales bacterium TaxID=768556 RepID=A0A6J4RWM9_9ACTN|nr:MAG: hypothetical protein AVDCRST_MAG17-299 [uncultured Solirubrobacterales bacterium]
MQIIGLILVGLVIGLLARLLLPGRQRIGLALTLLFGVAGAVIGGTLASLIGRGEIFELNVVGFIFALLASVGLLAIAEAAGIGAPKRGEVRGGRDRERMGR